MSDWDYIVIGAGSSGCAVANRLSADPKNKVLLLEAGKPDKGINFDIVTLGYLKLRGDPDTDWMFDGEPDPSRNGRSDAIPRGKALGGSSNLNGTIYVRGNRGDYDGWAQLGNRGWDYDSLIPLFRRMEDGVDSLSSSTVYGHGGPIKISETRGIHPLTATFIAAMKELGVPHNPDYNGEVQAGATVTHVTQRRGVRWSSARGYLRPARSRPNLRIETGVFVRTIVMDGKRAVGVELEKEFDGERRTERCSGEIIISASAINSPKLLMLSGIGDPEHLQSLGIGVVHANRHVGRNMQDHPACAVKAYVSQRTVNMDLSLWSKLRHGLRYMLFGSGPATHYWPALSFVKLRPEEEYPDIEYLFGAFHATKTKEGLKFGDRPGITLLPTINRGRSRGYVRLKSADPTVYPEIQQNLLGDPYDVETLMNGVRFARKILATKAFAPVFQSEYMPGPQITSDKALEEFVRATAATSYHQSGTVKMGADDTSVVDPTLRVIGVDRLRVADSSIIPLAPSGNLNAISLVIGEKAADMILNRA